MVSMTANRLLVSICVTTLMSACTVAPGVATKKPTEGTAKVRAAIETAVASSDS